MLHIVLAALFTIHAPQTPPRTPEKSIQTADVGIRKAEKRLVEQFPQVPIFKGARVESSYEKKEPGRIGYEATWTVPDSVSKVVAWYRRELPRQGWKILEYNEGEDEQNLLIQKGVRNAYLWVERKGDVTEITVEFPMKPEVP